jgi:prepilin-type N-terminal cleavage/methylation domain-containing protein
MGSRILYSRGFTIVELLVVIVIIGILAAIVIVSYNGVNRKLTDTVLSSDLNGASKQLKVAQTTSDNYATANDCSASPPAGTTCFKASSGTTYQYSYNNAVNPKTFCITATRGTTSFYITQDSAPTAGACPGHTAGGAQNPALPTWNQRSIAGAPSGWGINSIATSSDGTKLVATIGSKLYTSSNSGSTWTERITAPGGYAWAKVASSADGTRLYVSEAGDEDHYGGSFWTSGDSGATWTQRTSIPYGNATMSFAVSSDGSRIIASYTGVYGPLDVYTSTNYGVNWTQQPSVGQNYRAGVTISADGTKMTVANRDYANSYIYTSSNSGSSWTQRTSAGARNWSSIASSSDGTKLIAGEDQGPLFTSSDSGATWTQRSGTPVGYRAPIASSSDGTKLITAVSTSSSTSTMYLSLDSGVTWAAQSGPGLQNWVAPVMSASGDKMYYGVSYENKYYTNQ